MEIRRVAGSLSASAWGFIPPAVFVVRRVVRSAPTAWDSRSRPEVGPDPRLLGAVLILVGILRSLEVLSAALPAYLWAVTLLVASGLLITYREPEGAYEKPHEAH